jgi:hypothetical protein
VIGDALARFLGSPGALGRLVVFFCVGVMLVALVWLYPQAFAEGNRTARANANLDYLDRQLGGGNSVLPSQAIAIEARGRIPARDTFTVAVGTPRKGWSELAIPDSLENYMRYFLLPRQTATDAPWILCFACDRTAYPDARPVWEDQEDGLAILRRPA